jgi:hypothetical protein
MRRGIGILGIKSRTAVQEAWRTKSRACSKSVRGLSLALRFDPNQPRVPAGNPDGGQWSDGASGGLLDGLRPTRRPSLQDGEAASIMGRAGAAALELRRSARPNTSATYGSATGFACRHATRKQWSGWSHASVGVRFRRLTTEVTYADCNAHSKVWRIREGHGYPDPHFRSARGSRKRLVLPL